jgi:hypothetical protein
MRFVATAVLLLLALAPAARAAVVSGPVELSYSPGFKSIQIIADAGLTSTPTGADTIFFSGSFDTNNDPVTTDFIPDNISVTGRGGASFLTGDFTGFRAEFDATGEDTLIFLFDNTSTATPGTRFPATFPLIVTGEFAASETAFFQNGVAMPTSAEAVITPLPAGLPLFLSGLVGLGLWRRLRRR